MANRIVISDSVADVDLKGKDDLLLNLLLKINEQFLSECNTYSSENLEKNDVCEYEFLPIALRRDLLSGDIAYRELLYGQKTHCLHFYVRRSSNCNLSNIDIGVSTEELCKKNYDLNYTMPRLVSIFYQQIPIKYENHLKMIRNQHVQNMLKIIFF